MVQGIASLRAIGIAWTGQTNTFNLWLWFLPGCLRLCVTQCPPLHLANRSVAVPLRAALAPLDPQSQRSRQRCVHTPSAWLDGTEHCSIGTRYIMCAHRYSLHAMAASQHPHVVGCLMTRNTVDSLMFGKVACTEASIYRSSARVCNGGSDVMIADMSQPRTAR